MIRLQSKNFFQSQKFNKRHSFCLFLLMSAICLLLFTFGLSTNRPLLIDEAWYANPAYNFSIGNGFINTNVGSGGNANFLLPLIIGGLYSVFGVSIFVTRLASVLCGLIFLFYTYRFLKLYTVNHLGQFIVYLSIVSISFYYSIFTYARPEGLASMLVFASLFHFLKYYEEKNRLQIVWLTICVFCALLAHPMTVIFAFLYGLYFLFNLIKKWDLKLFLCLCLFFIMSVFGVLLVLYADYLYNNVNTELSFGTVIMDTLNRTSLSTNEVILIDGFEKNDTFIERFLFAFRFWFLTPRLLFSLFFISIISIGIFQKRSVVKLLSILALLYLVIAFIVFANDKFMTRHVFTYTFIVATVVFVLLMRSFNKRVLLFVLIPLFAINFMATSYNNFSKRENANLILQKEIRERIPAVSTVYGALNFWFFAPESSYFSNFYRFEQFCRDYDFLIINEFEKTALLSGFQGIDFEKYKLIYELHTRQYGWVRLYKNRRLVE